MTTPERIKLEEHERRLNAINGDVRRLAEEIQDMKEKSMEGHNYLGAQLAGIKAYLRVIGAVGLAVAAATVAVLFEVFRG